MAKRKKSKNVDFQKVKLKAGRVLKKSTNDFSAMKFKSRKIIMQDQFKRYGNFLSVEQVADLPQLVKDLNHPRANNKRVALTKLTELLESDEMVGHLYAILSKTLYLLMDADCYVREKALHLIRNFLLTSDEKRLKAFVPVFQSYSSCIMTHLDANVRVDSLKLFDLLLEHFPTCISSSGKLMKQFLELISFRKAPNSPRLLRVLAPGNKITAQEWRISVFERLLKLFEARLKSSDSRENSFPILAEVSSFHVKSHVDLYPPDMLSFSLDEGGMLSPHNSCEDDPVLLNDFLVELVPLLLQTWTESEQVLLSDHAVDGSLKSEALDSMIIVLKLLGYCADWVTLLESQNQRETVQKLKNSLSRLIQVNLFTRFPFHLDHVVQKSVKKKNLKHKTSYMNLNIDLCRIFALLVDGTEDCSVPQKQNVMKFLLLPITRKDLSALHLVIEVLEIFLLSEAVAKQCQPHIDGLYKTFKEVSPVSQSKKLIAEFFLKLALDVNFCYMSENPVLESFLMMLPSELIKMIDSNNVDRHLLKCVARISCRESFLSGLQENAFLVIKLLLSPDKSVQSAAAVLVREIPNLTHDHFYEIFNVLSVPSISWQVVNAVIQLLHCRFTRQSNPGFTRGSYHSFLLNMAVGVTSNPDGKEEPGLSCSLLKVLPEKLLSFRLVPSQHARQQEKILSLVVFLLSQFQPNVSANVQIFLVQFLKSVSCMPFYSAAAILKLYSSFVCRMQQADSNSQFLSAQVAELTFCFYLHEEALAGAIDNKETLESYSCLGILHENTRNISAILEVLVPKVASLKLSEDAVWIGRVLCSILRNRHLKTGEMQRITTLTRGLSKVIGQNVGRHDWWKELKSIVSSVSI